MLWNILATQSKEKQRKGLTCGHNHKDQPFDHRIDYLPHGGNDIQNQCRFVPLKFCTLSCIPYSNKKPQSVFQLQSYINQRSSRLMRSMFSMPKQSTDNTTSSNSYSSCTRGHGDALLTTVLLLASYSSSSQRSSSRDSVVRVESRYYSPIPSLQLASSSTEWQIVGTMQLTTRATGSSKATVQY